MPDFGIFRGFNEKLFGDKLYAGQLPTQLGLIGSESVSPFLLNSYPNAAAAYSLRKLRKEYIGNAIKVRRSVGTPSETDIGFVNNELDVTSLESFCSGTNGFVTTWYDQSGNGNDAEQTTDAAQPQIVSNGSVIEENGKPSVQFDGSNDYLFKTNLPFVFPTTAIVISTTVSINVNYLFDTFIPDQSINTNRMALRYRTENGGVFAIIDQNGTQKLTTNTYTANNQFLNFINFDNPNTNIYTNNSNQDTVATTYVNSTRTFNIGTFSGANNVFHDGTIQELILYPSDQSSDRTGIETNINDFYSIYS